MTHPATASQSSFEDLKPTLGFIHRLILQSAIFWLVVQPAGVLAQYGEDPLLDLPFSESAGLQAVDASGNGHDASLWGASWTTGIVGSALSFDGVDDFATISATTPPDLTEDMTFRIWVQMHSDPSSWTGILSKHQSGTLNEFTLRIKNSTTAQWYYGNGSIACVLSWNPSAYLPLDTWTQITGVRDLSAGKMTLYFNGVAGPSRGTCGPAVATKSSVLIGKQQNLDNYFHGIVDEVEIFGRAMTAAEVAWRYSIDTGATNLIPNASFESGSLDPLFPTVVRGTLEIDKAISSEGQFSLQHTATDDDSHTGPYTGPGAVLARAVAGEKFHFSAMAKANARSTVGLRIFCLDAAYADLGSGQGDFTATTAWQRFARTYTCPASTAYVGVRLDNAGGLGSTVWWDDLSLVRVVGNAQFVSQNVPATPAAGETAAVPAPPAQVKSTAPVFAEGKTKAAAKISMGPLTRSGGIDYFVNQGEAVYLTGSHTWDNLQDRGDTANFNYVEYLDMMTAKRHNFMRMWSWQNFNSQGDDMNVNPLPWLRTKAGNCFDLYQGNLDLGDPSAFDENKVLFNQGYFDRLAQRVSSAAARGIYVDVMLFQGFSVKSGSGNPWKFHPFNIQNNCDGVDGNLEEGNNNKGERFHEVKLTNPGSNLENILGKFQKAYVKKVTETLSSHGNVLYEIANEDVGSAANIAWATDMIAYISSTSMPNLADPHPVGMTSFGFSHTDNSVLSGSGADWISPAANSALNYAYNPPVPTGAAVIISDNDHIKCILETPNFQQNCVNSGQHITWPIRANYRQWIWKSFTRGLNVILMDAVENPPGSQDPNTYPAVNPNNPAFKYSRDYLGHTNYYAQRLDLSAAKPRPDLCSTGYCLADPGEEYLTYQPANSSFTVTLEPGTYTVEWFNPHALTSPPAKLAPVDPVIMASIVLDGTINVATTGPRTFANATSPQFACEDDGADLYECDVVLLLKRQNPPAELRAQPVADSFVTEDAATANYGTRTDLQIRKALVDNGSFSFLKFNVTGVSGSVFSAKLRIRTQETSIPDVGFYKMNNMNWSESTINWNNWDRNGAVGFTYLGAKSSLAPNTWHELDVTAAVTGNGVVNLGLASSTDLANLDFWSRESSYKPQLRIQLLTVPGVLVVDAAADAWVWEAQATANFGSRTDLRIRNDPPHSGRFSFLRFTVPQYSGTLVSAALRIRTMSTQVPTATVYRMNNMGNWNEATINWLNWDNMGAVSFTFINATGVLAADTWHEIDVTSAVSGPGSTLNLGMATEADQANLRFWSRESGNFPELIIHYVP